MRPSTSVRVNAWLSAPTKPLASVEFTFQPKTSVRALPTIPDSGAPYCPDGCVNTGPPADGAAKLMGSVSTGYETASSNASPKPRILGSARTVSVISSTRGSTTTAPTVEVLSNSLAFARQARDLDQNPVADRHCFGQIQYHLTGRVRRHGAGRGLGISRGSVRHLKLTLLV